MIGTTIFLPSGATFTFYNVTGIEENETVLSFYYVARSDERHKYALFYKKNIAGRSTFTYSDDFPGKLKEAQNE